MGPGEQERSISVISLNVEYDSELFGYFGFLDQDLHFEENGQSEYEISHGPYKAVGLNLGDGSIIIEMGPSAPKGMAEPKPHVQVVFRNGYSLSNEGLKIDPPEKWVLYSTRIGRTENKFPSMDDLNIARMLIRESLDLMREQKQQLHNAGPKTRARRGPRLPRLG